jgi:hypothetical protein
MPILPMHVISFPLRFVAYCVSCVEEQCVQCARTLTPDSYPLQTQDNNALREKVVELQKSQEEGETRHIQSIQALRREVENLL